MSALQKQRGGELPHDFATEVRAFEAGDIDPEKFDHEAHVRMAWSYLQQFPTAVAIARFTSALQSLTARLGIPDKYHETISWFFMIVIADRLARAPQGDWKSFRNGNRDLLEESAALIRRHYSRDCLNSAPARQRFLLPDRAL